MEYTSVSRHELQKAFALAHKLSEDLGIPATERKQFRKIAQLIWKAHGEGGNPPAGSGSALLRKFDAAEELANLTAPADLGTTAVEKVTKQ